jgi:hypothetical protein
MVEGSEVGRAGLVAPAMKRSTSLIALCLRGHPEATLRPSDSQPVGTPKPPSGYPEATLRLP